MQSVGNALFHNLGLKREENGFEIDATSDGFGRPLTAGDRWVFLTNQSTPVGISGALPKMAGPTLPNIEPQIATHGLFVKLQVREQPDGI